MDCTPSANGDCSKFSYDARTNWRTRSALLQVCQAIRYEAVPTFYRNSTIHFRIDKHNYNGLVDWLHEIGKEQARLIPKLVITWEPTQQSLDAFSTADRAIEEARDVVAEERLQAFLTRHHSSSRRFRMSSLSKQKCFILHIRLQEMGSNETAAHQEAIDALERYVLSSGIARDAIVLGEDTHQRLCPDLLKVQSDFISTLKRRLSLIRSDEGSCGR